MKKLLMFLLISGCFKESIGSDPTMDYNSLQGSGISPQEYDLLVQHRQLKYSEQNVGIDG